MSFTNNGTSGIYYEYAISNGTIDSNEDALALLGGTGQASTGTGTTTSLNYSSSVAGVSGDDFAVRFSTYFTPATGHGGLWDIGAGADDGIIIYIDGNLQDARTLFGQQAAAGIQYDGSFTGDSTFNFNEGQTYLIEVVFWDRGNNDNVFVQMSSPTSGASNLGETTNGSYTTTQAVPAPNVAPEITLGTVGAIDVNEGDTAVTDVDATDADMDTLTYSISGGADQLLFDINSATGVLTFKNAPDFETATDADTNGSYIVDVTATDGDGASDTETVTVTVQNVAPAVTSITAATNNASGTVSKAGDTITYTVNFDEVVTATGSALTLAGGDSAAYSTGSGSNQVTFIYTVQAGDTGADLEVSSNTGSIIDGGSAAATGVSTSALGLSIDTSAPLAPMVALTTDSGTDGDLITNVATLSVTGTEGGATVQFSDDDSSWSTTQPTPDQGPNTFYVRQVDTAGNASPSTSIAFTFDDVAPVNGAPTVALTNDSGTDGDKITNDATLTVSNLEAGATVEYSANNTDWSTTQPTPTQGSNTVHVRQVDVAGNASASDSITFMFDDQITGSPSLSVNFTNANGDTTFNASETIYVAIDGIDSDASGSVLVSSAGGGSVTIPVTSATSSPIMLLPAQKAALSDGTLSVELSVSDTAGNTAMAMSNGFDLDTTPPVSEDETVALAEITDQDAATTGTTVVLAMLSGADDTDYALSGTGGAYDVVTLHDTGTDWELRIIDDAAARGFFDFEANPMISVDVIGTDDAGNTTTSTIDINLSNLNDAPEAGAGPDTFSKTLFERADGVAGENDTPFSTTGSYTVHDDDVGNTHNIQVSNVSAVRTIDGASAPDTFLGILTAGFSDPINGDGNGVVNWTFNIGFPVANTASQMATVDALAAGETIVQTYNVTVIETNTDPALSYVQPVTVTITGTNDVPVFSSETAGAIVVEPADGITDMIETTGTLSVADVDFSDDVTVSVTTVTVGAGTFDGTNPLLNDAMLALLELDGGTGFGTDTGSLSASGTGSDFTWKFAAAHNLFDFLPDGETLVLEYTLTADDANGGTPTKTVTITVTGSNDQPEINGASTAVGVLEAGGVHNASMGQDSVSGNLTDSNNWTDADDGETATLGVRDGSHGMDAQAGLIFDGMTGEAEIAGTYGSLFLQANGTYRYMLNDNATATQALNAADDVTEVFNYTIANGPNADDIAMQTLTVNITGSNDAPVISFAEGANLGTVTEAGVDALNADVAGTVTVSDTLMADDVDAENNASNLIWGVSEQVGQGTNIAGDITSDYGTFSVDGNGTWTFTLDNSLPAVKALHDSETATEDFTVTVTDAQGTSTEQTVTITINGTNDRPTIAALPDADISVTEQGLAADGMTVLNPGTADNQASGAFSFSDDDTGGSESVPLWSIVDGSGLATDLAAAIKAGTYGSLSLTDMGAWTYTLDDTNPATQALNASSSVTDVFTVRVADSLGGFSELDVTVNIAGTNDAPNITVDTLNTLAPDTDSDSVQESNATGLTTSGTLTISDVDASDSVAITVDSVAVTGTTAGSYAAPLADMLSISAGTPLDTAGGNASGSFTWAFDSGLEAFDFLANGESITLAYTVQADDGDTTDTQIVTVTVNGTNDQPEISVGSGSAAETIIESDPADLDLGGHLVTSGTLDISDADTSDTHTVSASLATGGVVWTDNGTSGSAGTLPLALETALAVGMTGAFNASINEGDPKQIDWDFALADTLADFLGAGETLTVTYDVTVNDLGGFDGMSDDEASVSAVQQVVVTITGTNDAPSVTADALNSFVEGDALDINANSVSQGANAADTVTVNLLGSTGDVTTEGMLSIDVTTVTELDTNDVRTITGTTSIVQGGGLTGFPWSDVENAFDLGAPGAESITFNRNAAVFDMLDDGEFIEVLLGYTVTTTSPDGTTTDDTVSTAIRVTGANDAPYIVDESGFAGDITELADGFDDGNGLVENGAQAQVQGTITFNDVDPGDISGLSVVTEQTQGTTVVGGPEAALLENYVGTFQAGFAAPSGGSDGLVFYTFDLNDSVLDNLAAGEQFTQSYEVAISDGTTTTSRPIVLTFTGTNDAPRINAISSDTAYGLVEDAGVVETGSTATQTLEGTISFDDVDTSTMATLNGNGTADTHTVSAVVKEVAIGGMVDAAYAGATGNLTFDAAAANGLNAVSNQVDWTYTITDGGFDFLPVGETAAVTFTVTVDDGQGGTDTIEMTYTVTGSNDAATIAGVTSGAVAEDGDGVATFQTVDGTLTISDADTGEAVFDAVTAGTAGDNGYGTFGMDANGNWTYTLTNGHADVQALAATESLTDTITVSSVDGTDTQQISVTINGTNDAPVLDASGGMDTAAGSTGEDLVSASGTLTLSDVDLTNTASVAVSAVAVFIGNDNGIANATLEGMMSLSGALDAAETSDSVTWTFSAAAGIFDYLNQGESVALDYTLTATDSSAAEGTQVVRVIINGSNDLPTVSVAIADQTTAEDAAFSLDVSGNFADLDVTDVLTFSLGAGAPAGMTIDGGTGVISWTPDNDDVGLNPVTVIATDDNNASVFETFDVTVSNTNDAPVVSVAIADQTTDEDAAFSLDVSGNFADDDIVHGDSLAFSLTSAPAWMSIDQTTGVITGTPLNDDVSTASVTVSVTDGEETVTDTFEITVDNTNDAPVINVGASTTAPSGDEDTTISGTISTSDVDVGDVLSYALQVGNEPGHGSVIFDGMGGYTYTPTGNYNGSDTFVVEVTDVAGASDTVTVNVTVDAVNDAPVNTVPVADYTTDEDNAVNLVGLSVTDVDITGNVTVTLSVASGAGTLSAVSAGVTVVGDGTNSIQLSGSLSDVNALFVNNAPVFTPGLNLNGDVTLTMLTSDNGSSGSGGILTDTDTVTISVTPVNDAPVAQTAIVTPNLPENTLLSFTVVSGIPGPGEVSLGSFASDVDGDIDPSSLSLTGVTFDGTPQTLTDAGISYVGGMFTIDTNAALYQSLDAADTVSLVVGFAVTDSGMLSDTGGQVTVTVEGINDIPTLADINIGTLTETAGDDSGLAGLSGTLLGADNDADDTAAALTYWFDGATVQNDLVSNYTEFSGNYGVLRVFEDGSYEYTPDLTAINALPDGAPVDDDFVVTITDTKSASSTATITVTIDPANDTPELAVVDDIDIDDTAAADDFTAQGGTLSATDRDAGHVASMEFTIDGLTPTNGETSQTFYWDRDANMGAGGVTTAAPINGEVLGTLTVTTAGGYSFDPDDAGINNLRDNGSVDENPVIVVTLRAQDDQEAAATTNLTINIDGANDNPIVDIASLDPPADEAGVVQAAAKELAEGDTGTIVAEGGSISFTDIDSTSLPSFNFQALGSGYVGSISFTPSGGTVASGAVGWDFEVADSILNTLAEGEAFNTSPQLYNIIISDGQGGSVTQQVAITITGSNDAPVISGSLVTGDVTEAAAGAVDATITTAGSLTVTDVDLIDDVEVSVTGATVSGGTFGGTLPAGVNLQSMLTLAAGTGITTGGTSSVTVGADTGSSDVSWIFASGATGDASFDFLATGEELEITYTVTADDEAWLTNSTAMQTVVVTVTGSNDGPIAAAGIETTVNEDTADVTLATASATDPDLSDNADLSYTITAGNGSSLFEIDSATGAISLAAGETLDAEAAQQHVLTVEVEDTDGLTDTQQVTINVDDVDEFPTTTPTDTDTAANEVNENATSGTVGITALATDADITGEAVTYAIVGGTGQNDFVIDANTGVVSVSGMASINREDDADLTIDVQATDANGTPGAIETFTIAVNDVNEFSVAASMPEDSDVTANDVAEDATGGTSVGITASGADEDATDTVSYSLATGDDTFDIDATTGAITLDANALLDHETSPTLSLQVLMTSTDGSTTTADYTVNVTDVDDEAPTFNLLATSFDVDENTSTDIVTLDASDVDSAPQDISFSIVGGADGSLFTIDPLTNGLAFSAPQNFENPSDTGGDGTYEVTVRASDGAGNVTDQTITVSLVDVNEAPTAVTLDSAVTTIAENTVTTSGVKVADINISDDALGTNAVSLTGDDAALFTTVDNGGQLELHYVGASPDFEAAADFNTDGTYDVTVVVDDLAVGATPDVTVDFSLAVTDVNEAPVGDNDIGDELVGAEDSIITLDLTDPAVLALFATDPDNNVDASTFSFGLIRYDGVSVTEAEAGFSYSAATKVITIDTNADLYQSENVNTIDAEFGALQLFFDVEDAGGIMTSGRFDLAVTGVNDAPVVDLLNSDVVLTTNEDISISGTITATDVDGGTLVYSVETGDAPTNGLVVINASNGDYTYTPSPNSNGTDSFTVSIFDGVDTITQVVNLTVDAVDDAPMANDTVASTDEDMAISYFVDPLIVEVDDDVFTVTASVDPSQGTVSVLGTVITFTPFLDYNGPAPITYTVTDTTTNALYDTGTVNMTVNAVDDAPEAADDVATTDEDTLTIINVATLITEVDDDTVEVTASVDPAEGSVTVSGTLITFTPTENFNGTATITYTVTDDTMDELSDSGTVSVTVDAVNDASELDATAQITPTFTEAVDGAVPVPVAVADAVIVSDVDGLDYDSGVLSAAVTSGDTSDELALDTSGAVAVSGSDVSVNSTVVGTVAGLGTATLSVTFAAAALAADVQAVVQALTYVNTSESPVATRDITLDLSDGDGLPSMQQTVSVDITAVNDAPVANNVAFGASEGAFASTVNVTTFGTPDSDPEGDSFTVTAVADVDDDPLDLIAIGGSATVNGSAGVITTDWGAEVTLQSNGQLFYNLTSGSPRFNELAQGESAVDSFTYTITDANGGTDTATVAVNITGTNDNIVAVADSIDTTEDAAAMVTGNLLANDTDVDVTDTRSIVAVNGSVSATSIATSGGYQITTLAGVVILLDADGSYTMTAPDALNGAQVYTATFQYTVQDGGSTQSTTTVTVNVTGDNDAPNAVAVTLTASDEDTVRIITEAELLAGASDPDASAMLEITDLSLTSGNGMLADNGDGTWTYTPDFNDNSSVTFNYTISDGSLTATASAGLDLLPVNVAPEIDDLASDTSVSGDEDTSISGSVVAADGDLDTLSFALLTGGEPANGAVTFDGLGGYTYTPDADFNGTDSFTVEVTDGNGGSDTVVVSVTVDPINDAPVIDDLATDTTVSGDEDTAIIGSVVAVDVEDDTLSFALLTGGEPANGAVTFDGLGGYTYTPDGDFSGTDSFTVEVSDGNGSSDTVVVNVTVDPVNDAPVIDDLATDTIVSGDEDVAISGTVVAADVEGDTLSFALLTGGEPANGAVTFDGLGGYTYTPNADFNGTDSFTVEVTDGNGGSDTVVVSVTVDPINDAPVIDDLATDTTVSGDEDTAIIGSVVAADAEGDILSYAVAIGGEPANGAVTFDGLGGYTYTPDGDFSGTDSFTVEVSDGNDGSSDMVVVSVTVDPVNDAAVVGGVVSGSVDENSGVAATGALTAADVDNTDDVFIAASGITVFGSYSIDAAGVWTYTADDANATVDALNPGDTLPDSFVVASEDGTTQTISITINGASDGPTEFADALLGSVGNDRIDALGGDDTVDGDAGNDRIWGRGGNDSLLGNSGVDTISGDDGDDFIDGGADNDRLFGNSGQDTVVGDFGHDYLDGGLDNDNLSGGIGNDTLLGGGGNDTLDGGGGLDILYGQGGDDYLFGGVNAFSDTLYGGNGNDTLEGGGGPNLLVGDAGHDSLIGNNNLDTLEGGYGQDTLIAGDSADIVDGGGGNDSLFGNGGNDTLTGGSGDDWMDGGANRDVFVFGDVSGDDTIANFQNYRDQMDISSLDLAGFADLVTAGAITASGSSTIIDLNLVGGDGTVLLEGFDVTMVDATDFIF